MRLASLSENPIGFSTRTGRPRSNALHTAAVCCCSGGETITAVTSGCEMTSSLLPDAKSAPACSASARARVGSRSEIARKRTDGCLAASRARRVPMRPAPTTAMPRLDCFMPFNSQPRCVIARASGRSTIPLHLRWLLDCPRARAMTTGGNLILVELPHLVLEVGPDARIDVAEFGRDRKLGGWQARPRQVDPHHRLHPAGPVGRDQHDVGQEDRLVQVVGHEQHGALVLLPHLEEKLLQQQAGLAVARPQTPPPPREVRPRTR